MNNFSSLLLVAVAADAVTADVDAVALHPFGQTNSATVDGRRGDFRDLDEGVQHGMLLA